MAVASVPSKLGPQMAKVNGASNPSVRVSDLKVIGAFCSHQTRPGLGEYNNGFRQGIGFELSDKGNLLAFYSGSLSSMVLLDASGKSRAEVNIGKNGEFGFVHEDAAVTPSDMAALWKKAAKYTSDYKSGLIGIDKAVKSDFAKSSDTYYATIAALEKNEVQNAKAAPALPSVEAAPKTLASVTVRSVASPEPRPPIVPIEVPAAAAKEEAPANTLRTKFEKEVLGKMGFCPKVLEQALYRLFLKYHSHPWKKPDRFFALVDGKEIPVSTPDLNASFPARIVVDSSVLAEGYDWLQLVIQLPIAKQDHLCQLGSCLSMRGPAFHESTLKIKNDRVRVNGKIQDSDVIVLTFAVPAYEVRTITNERRYYFNNKGNILSPTGDLVKWPHSEDGRGFDELFKADGNSLVLRPDAFQTLRGWECSGAHGGSLAVIRQILSDPGINVRTTSHLGYVAPFQWRGPVNKLPEVENK